MCRMWRQTQRTELVSGNLRREGAEERKRMRAGKKGGGVIFAKKKSKSNCAEQRSPINTIIGVGINYVSEFRWQSYRFPSAQMLFQ